MLDVVATPFQFLIAFGYAMPRFLAVFSILPLLSREAFPTMLRVGVVGSMAVLMVPSIIDQVAQERTFVTALLILGKEGIIGLALGVALAIPLWAFETIGDLADTQRGASIAQTLNPLTGHETSPLGQLFNQAVVTMLFATGGFVAMIAVLYDSYAIWPIFGFWPKFDAQAPGVFLAMLDRLMYLAVLLSAPVIFAMFLAEAGLALVSRFAPQLQVFFLAMPIKSGLAMLVFAVYAVVLFDYGQELLSLSRQQALENVSKALTGSRKP